MRNTIDPTLWRYCGQFSFMTQAPIPRFGWITEAAARDRLHEPSAFITAVSPIDIDSGGPYSPFAARYLVITPAKNPSYTAVEQVAPGLPAEVTTWRATDASTLFPISVVRRTYPPVDQMKARNKLQALTVETNRFRPDGTSSRNLRIVAGKQALLTSGGVWATRRFVS